MPVNQEDRTTVVLGAGLIRAARERAEAEGRGFSAVVADALNAYLARPAADGSVPGGRTSGNSPKSTSSLGEIPVVPLTATAGLEAEVRALLGAVRVLLPDVRRVVEGHDETMDTLDQINAEIARRDGAALALEKVRTIADGR